MPSHKVLKSVANSLVGSFVGLLNYWHDDYVMGHVIQAAWLTGATEFEFDLVAGQALAPSPLLVSSVAGSLALLHERLPDLVVRSGSSMGFVSAASLRVTVDPTVKRAHFSEALADWPTSLMESPFTCSATIVDDRSRAYSHQLADWWFTEHAEGEGYTAREVAGLASNKGIEQNARR